MYINKINNFIGNQPYLTNTYGIDDTGDTQHYIKVDTPWTNKVAISKGPQVLLTDRIFAQ